MENFDTVELTKIEFDKIPLNGTIKDPPVGTIVKKQFDGYWITLEYISYNEDHIADIKIKKVSIK